MRKNNNVDELISQMRAAVNTARGARTAATMPAPAVPYVSPMQESQESPALLALIKELMEGVENRFGIKPGALVERKLVRIFKDMPINTLRDWVQGMNSCTSDHSEWQSLVENLTVHETYFCRDPDLMNMLVDEILPYLIQSRTTHQQLQVWSAASSTGEEVYDLAYSCLRGLQKASFARLYEGKIVPERGWALYVLGTDISNQALRTAREGVYGDLGMGSFRGLPEVWKGMFEDVKIPPSNAMPGVNYLKVRDWIKHCVRFERFNLMNSRPPVQGIDLVFCRNVLIYFEDEVKREVQKMLARAMAPGGVLVMGASVQMLAPEYFEHRLGRGGPWYVRNEVRV